MKFNKIVKSGVKYILDANYRFLINAGFGFYDSMPDAEYLQKVYKAHFGKTLDLDSPQTYNEKLQWLKLYDRKPEYTMMVDKYKVRDYVAEQLGEEYLIPLLGVWDDPDEIDFDDLPNQFVLKCNHNSGLGMCICKDKSQLDIVKVKENLKKGMKQDYYLSGREWPYKDVPRRIIAEQYMEDSETAELRDYKFFCFSGEPKALFVATDRQTPGEEVKFDFFDLDYRHLNFKQGHQNAKEFPTKPKQFELMKELAKKLSKNIPHVRVDFYEANDKVFFGEMTFFHFSGIVPFEPEEWDYTFGEWIRLPSKREKSV